MGLARRLKAHALMRIVGLAAEVVARDEQLADVLLAARSGRRRSRRGPPRRRCRCRCRRDPRRGAPPPPPRACRTARRARARRRGRAAGDRVLEGLPVALLPVPDQIGVQRARPAHAAFQEGEVQLREAPGDPAQEEGLGHGLAGGGEVADVVVAEVRRRIAQEDRARPVVEARRDAQLAALLPHRVVVVRAVEADHVVPLHELRGVGVLGGQGGDGPPDEAAHHDRPCSRAVARRTPAPRWPPPASTSG